MLLEKESHVLEKIKLLSVAFDYAEKKGQILDSNLYHGSTYNCPPKKEVIEFMETFHALDAFVYGTCAEDSLFGCDARSGTPNRRRMSGGNPPAGTTRLTQ